VLRVTRTEESEGSILRRSGGNKVQGGHGPLGQIHKPQPQFPHILEYLCDTLNLKAGPAFHSLTLSAITGQFTDPSRLGENAAGVESWIQTMRSTGTQTSSIRGNWAQADSVLSMRFDATVFRVDFRSTTSKL